MFSLLFAITKFIPFMFGAACDKSNMFFFLPPWYEYIDTKFDSACNISTQFIFPDDIWLVALAILDMLLRLAGFVAIIAMIAGGVGYITAQGNPEKAASARRRIYNGFIGLAIASIAAGLVAFIGNKLGG